MNSAPALASNVSPVDLAWRQHSVRLFFETMAWEGQPATISALGRPAVLAPTLTLSVAHFFASVPWTGPTVVAAPVVTSGSPAPVASTLTLEAFSDLF